MFLLFLACNVESDAKSDTDTGVPMDTAPVDTDTGVPVDTDTGPRTYPTVSADAVACPGGVGIDNWPATIAVPRDAYGYTWTATGCGEFVSVTCDPGWLDVSVTYDGDTLTDGSTATITVVAQARAEPGPSYCTFRWESGYRSQDQFVAALVM